MASKRRQRRKMCDGKVRHGSMEAAVVACNRLQRKQPDDRFTAYHCGKCGGHHAGHVTHTALQAMAARRS